MGSTGNKWPRALAILREERASTGACSAAADSVAATVLHFVAAAAGVATMAAIGYQWLPPGVIAVAFALFFILTLPRQPRLVAAYCVGVVLAMVVAFVVITVAWTVPAS